MRDQLTESCKLIVQHTNIIQCTNKWKAADKNYRSTTCVTHTLLLYHCHITT